MGFYGNFASLLTAVNALSFKLELAQNQKYFRHFFSSIK